MTKKCPYCGNPMVDEGEMYTCVACGMYCNKIFQRFYEEVPAGEVTTVLSDEHSTYMGIGAIYPAAETDER